MRNNLVTTKEHIIKNMDTIDSYLTVAGSANCGFAKDLIQRGRCFAYRIIDGEYHFYPSRFIGYIDNNVEDHKLDMGDGRDTNHVISKVLKTNLEENEELEREYLGYLSKLRLDSYKFERKYWNIDIK